MAYCEKHRRDYLKEQERRLEAQDPTAALRARIAELEGALERLVQANRPRADLCNWCGEGHDPHAEGMNCPVEAAEALTPKPEQQG